MGYLLHHLLRDAAEAAPDAVAVVDEGRSLAYGELDDRSGRLANVLSEAGVARGDRVGLYAEKSMEALIGVYGILRAGAAYVPLDARAPVSRLAYIAEDCGIRVLLSTAEHGGAWSGLAEGGGSLETVVLLRGEEPPEAAGLRIVTPRDVDRAPGDPAVPCIDEDLAYILYTSGSTGRPKGVMLSHRNALTFVEWAAREVKVAPADRLSSHAPLHFDLSVFDVFAAAAGRAATVLVPTSVSILPIELGGWIRRSGITVWYSVPSVLSMLALRGALNPGDLPELRAVIFAGEVFPTRYLRRMMELVPAAEFLNWYGPTETNVCTAYRVPRRLPGEDEPIPIGVPIDNVEVFAIDDAGTKTRRGDMGELHVRGGSVMRGYWGDRERSARALIPDPVGAEPRDLVYRTGDLVRQDEDGQWHYVGRRDAQIKSRGYRIELGEIEAALHAHPTVVECAVTAIPDELVTNRIKAVIVPRERVASGELVRFLRERLPRYMIPDVFEFSARLPRTSTGKIDRQSLTRA
jgi:amino acid adenylation domain-containing protein